MSVVAVELFDRVDEFAKGVKKSPKKFWKDKSANEAIGVFCENFFSQFFGSLGLQITGFGVKAKEAAVRKRLSLQNRKSAQPIRQLIAEYEDLCEIWDDIQGARYIENRQAIVDFACTFLPALLEDAVEWLATLTSQDDQRALGRARESETKYKELVKPTCP